MPLQVCMGAMMMCSFGMAPSTLVVLPTNKVLTGEVPDDLPRLRGARLLKNRIRELPRNIGRLEALEQLTLCQNELASLPATTLAVLWAGAFFGGFASGAAGFAYGVVAAAIWLHDIDPLHTTFLVVTGGLAIQTGTIWPLRTSQAMIPILDPPVNVLDSLSRLMPAVTTPGHRTRAATVRRLLAVHARSEDLVRIGAYKAGTDDDLDRAIRAMPVLREFLEQQSHERVTLQETVAATIQLWPPAVTREPQDADDAGAAGDTATMRTPGKLMWAPPA